jgi:hypothetical protein
MGTLLIMKPSIFLLMAAFLLQPALGQEIANIYSDLQSCDVTVEGAVKGDRLKIDLSTEGNVVQSRTLALDGPGTWVIMWDSMPSEDSDYTVQARLFENRTLLSGRSFEFHYGGQVPVRFDVRDFRADSAGVHLLIYAPDMAIVDLYHMLIQGNKALYVAKDTSLSILDNTRVIDRDWKQLLVKGENYSGRIKIVENGTGQIRSFMSQFQAAENARITDTYGDEIGASATIIGDSMVPLSGALKFILSKDGRTLVTEEKKTPVLLKDDDETVEVSWNRTLDPGIYHLKITLLGEDNELIDFKEIVIEAKKSFNLTAVKSEKPQESSQNTILILGIVMLAAAAVAIYVIRKRR